MQLTLGQASKQIGVSKPTLSKAISTGKLSATRREDGSFAIDPAELCRYVEANGHRFQATIGNGLRVETQPATPATDAVAVQLAGLAVEVGMLREQLGDARRDRDDARQERDHWRDQAQRLALPKPIEPEQPTWWRWLRSTG